jgi:hypothetical protein
MAFLAFSGVVQEEGKLRGVLSFSPIAERKPTRLLPYEGYWKFISLNFR